MKHVVVTATVDDDELAALCRPQDHFVRERAEGPGHFVVDVGPFNHWERRVAVEPAPGPGGRHRVTTTIDFALALVVWTPPLTLALARNLRRTGGRGRRSWWMPPLTDARSTSVVGVLAALAVIAGYLGVLLSQTNAFVKAEFGATSSQMADAQIAIRVGAFAALAVVARADRWGRRRVLLVSIVAGILLAATGALTTDLWGITLSQGVARVFSSAALLVIALMSSEEVAASARASAQSILALAGGLGAGALVLLLPLADLSPGSWRLLYLVPLPLLAAVPALARRLPETRRFEVLDLRAHQARGAGGAAPAEADPGAGAPTGPARRDRRDRSLFVRRLVLVGSMLALFQLFVTPWSGFTNDFLTNERDFAAWQLTLFQVVTNLPSGLAILLGGRLADAFGRRLVGGVGLVGGAVSGAAMYLTDGWALWGWSTAATVLGGLIIPTVLVYPTEMFSTGTRGRAQGMTNLAAVAGAVVGLKACGVIADRWGSFGPAMALLAVAPVLAAVILLVWFPETTRRELEELNPGDLAPPAGDDLASLDRRWEVAHEHGRRLATHEATHEQR